VSRPLDRWEGRDTGALARSWGLPRLVVLAETASSNDVAREVAEQGAPHGTAVLAEWQSAGRGRRGRSWIGRPGESLLASLVLRPSPGRSVSGALPLRVGLAAADACERTAGCRVAIKWPNDLLVGGRKLGGILCEAYSTGESGFVVVGIGINVHGAPDAWPPEIAAAATSLDVAAARPVSRLELAAALLPALAALDPAAPLSRSELRDLDGRDALRDRIIELDDGSRGTARGFRTDGALRLEASDGERAITHGSIRHASAPDDAR